jgi:N-methylhydantoinase A
MLLGVDVGGTFTDAVLVAADGSVHTAKEASTPLDQSAGVMRALAGVLARAGASAGEVERFAHGMTVATNALLEGRGARTALIATEGFTDIVELARQARPHLYELCLAGPEPLAPPELRFGAPERTGPEGVLRALNGPALEAMLERLARAAPQAVAVVLLHSYAHPAHEEMLGELLADQLPGVHVSLSHELVGTFREYERAATTEVDAALSPLLAGYLEQLSERTRAAGLAEVQIMQSSGGLTDRRRASSHAALTVLSGPAGGVGGALLLAEAAGEPDVLCFDMGGTSCDVCLIEGGRVAETAERIVAGRPLALPMLDIYTVGAGGGSIAWRDPGGALRVGPQSAGAEPGPACYGHGGLSPTVTDANLLLGRLLADVALADGRTLDVEAAGRAVGALAASLQLDLPRCAEGILEVAEAEMLRALRVMTVERGIDPRRFALMAFGGAGPLHVCALAERLGIERILCPGASGVLSALGLAAAAPRRDVARTVMLGGELLRGGRLAAERDDLARIAIERLATPPVRLRLRYELRYRGQSFELPVQEELGPAAEPESGLTPERLREAFSSLHAARYGYSDETAEVELVTIRASAWGAAPALRLRRPARPSAPAERREVVLGGRTLAAELLRGVPAPGLRVAGPALWALPEATLLISPPWTGEVDEQGTIRLWKETEPT